MNEIDKCVTVSWPIWRNRNTGQFHIRQKLVAQLRMMSTYDDGFREVLEELVPGIPSTSVICPPFYCDHGHGIRLGEHVFVNANCTFLDGGYITIGAHTLIGPNVQIYTPHHPVDYITRREPKEYAYPVTIGEDCWIGGGAILCPGVKNRSSLYYRSRKCRN